VSNIQRQKDNKKKKSSHRIQSRRKMKHGREREREREGRRERTKSSKIHQSPMETDTNQLYERQHSHDTIPQLLEYEARNETP
jgi:hypothetical protein